MNQPSHSKSDRKIHILFFTPSLGNGGAEMHVLRLLNHLDRSQFRLSVAVAQPGGTYEAVLAEDVAVHPLNPPGIRSSAIRMMRAIAPLRQLVQAEQPDILCAFQTHANLAAVWACRTLPQPPKLVLGVQNNPSVQCRRSWHPWDRTLRSLLSTLYPQADKIIALSHGVATALQTMVPRTQNLIEVIYNAGVDAKVLSGAEEPIAQAELPATEPLILACGRLHPQKGYPHLLQAMQQVRRVVPAQLWIVGKGAQRAALEAQTQQLGLTDCVQFKGFQKNPYQFMAAADVFVLSSLYEGFGNVIVEAMACGTPVVATDCPYGPAEIIQDGVSGVLVPPANPTTLADAIIRVLTDPALRQTLSTNGRQRSQDFHAEAIATAYANSFLQLLNYDQQKSTLVQPQSVCV